MKITTIQSCLIVILFISNSFAQINEIEGSLKLPDIVENESIDTLLAKDTDGTIYSKALSSILLPSSGIVLSRNEKNLNLINNGYSLIGAVQVDFNLKADSTKLHGEWEPLLGSNPPDARYGHLSFWTGDKMIIWGGFKNSGYALNSGGIYDPQTDSWTTISTVNAPEIQDYFVGVWTGDKMIIFTTGQSNSDPRFGRFYDPNTDTWETINVANSTKLLFSSHAIWTGTEMIIWETNSFNGLRYNPSSDSWSNISNVNAPERTGKAVWSGTEMLVWTDDKEGGRYNPTTDSWTAISKVNSPGKNRYREAVWAGDKMIVWGGFQTNPDPNGIYYPSTDTWDYPTFDINLTRRAFHHLLWTGTDLIIFGGGITRQQNSGAKYNPESQILTSINQINAPAPRINSSAIWADDKMIVWGGNTQEEYTSELNDGGIYYPNRRGYSGTNKTVFYVYEKD